jgi:hypothetical protein
MYSSPVRHFTSVLLRLLVRLACVKRAASVRSEPGSNSHELGVLRIWIQGPPLQYTLPCSFAVTHSIQLSKNKTNRSRTYYNKKTEPVKGRSDQRENQFRGSSREVSLYSPTSYLVKRRVIYFEKFFHHVLRRPERLRSISVSRVTLNK